MDKLDLKIQKMATQYLSIPEDFNRRTEQTLKNIKYRKSRKLNLKNWLIRIIAVILSFGGVTAFAYVGVQTYNKYFVKFAEGTSSEIFNEIEMNYDEETEIKYAIIDNDEKLEKIQNAFDNIPNVDFENEYLLIIEFRNSIIEEMNILKTESDVNTTYITLGNEDLKNNNTANAEPVMCYVLENETKRDNIKFKIIPGSESIVKYGFTSMNDIAENYFNETAYNENCLVCDEKGNILSNNQQIINDFIESCNSGNNSALRIVKKEDNIDTNKNYEFSITDIIYENNEYYLFNSSYYEKEQGEIFADTISIAGGKSFQVEKADGFKSSEIVIYYDEEDENNYRVISRVVLE